MLDTVTYRPLVKITYLRNVKKKRKKHDNLYPRDILPGVWTAWFRLISALYPSTITNVTADQCYKKSVRHFIFVTKESKMRRSYLRIVKVRKAGHYRMHSTFSHVNRIECIWMHFNFRSYAMHSRMYTENVTRKTMCNMHLSIKKK